MDIEWWENLITGGTFCLALVSVPVVCLLVVLGYGDAACAVASPLIPLGIVVIFLTPLTARARTVRREAQAQQLRAELQWIAEELG